MANQIVLPQDVAANFKLAKDAPVVFFDKDYGDIDFRSISLEKATELADAGNPYLQKLNKKSV